MVYLYMFINLLTLILAVIVMVFIVRDMISDERNEDYIKIRLVLYIILAVLNAIKLSIEMVRGESFVMSLMLLVLWILNAVLAYTTMDRY